MVGLPFFLAIALLALLLSLIGLAVVGLLLPWRAFASYSVMLALAALAARYLSDLPSAVLVVCAIVAALATFSVLVMKGLRRRNEDRRPSAPALGLMLAALYVVAPILIDTARFSSLPRPLPERFHMADTVYRPRQLLRDCEISIWQHESITRFSAADWQALAAPLHQAGFPRREATPYRQGSDALSPDDAWLRGLGCSQAPSEHLQFIVQALNEPGAYFATNGRTGLAVLPSRGWIVQAWASSRGSH